MTTATMQYTYQGYIKSSSLAEGRSYGYVITFDDGYSVTKSGCYYYFAKDKVGIADMAFNGMYYWVKTDSSTEKVKILHEELGQFPLLLELMERTELVPPGPQIGYCTGTIAI